MKKVLAITMALVMAFCFAAVSFATDADSAAVYVTISDRGNLVVAFENVVVTDIDNDGALTVNDALYCAHEAYYDGGAAAGYESEDSAWGLSITRMWGQTNNGGFGYYVNDASSWSLADPVKEGDRVYAFNYADTQGWSDVYAFFDKTAEGTTQYSTVTLTLKDYAGFSTESAPVEGAEILINGNHTGVYTDKNGNATIEIDTAGRCVVSAAAPDGMIITPPVCVVTAEKAGISDTITHCINVIMQKISSFFAGIAALFTK